MIEDRTLLEDQPVSNKILIVSNDKDGENALWYTPHYRITSQEILQELDLTAYSNVDGRHIVIMCQAPLLDIIGKNDVEYYIDSIAEVLSDIGKFVEIKKENICFRNDINSQTSTQIALGLLINAAYTKYVKKDSVEELLMTAVNVQYKNRPVMVPTRLLMRQVDIKEVYYWKNQCHYFVEDAGIYKCLPDCFNVDYKVMDSYDKNRAVCAIIIYYTYGNKEKAQKLAAYLANVYGLENPYA